MYKASFDSQSLPRRQQIWFWQINISLHIIPLAKALASLGHCVYYCYSEPLSAYRQKMGWSIPDLHPLIVCNYRSSREISRLVDLAAPDSWHITQGFWFNSSVSRVQSCLRRKRIKELIVFESIDDHGPKSLFKKLAYSILVHHLPSSVRGYLAIGRNTPSWISGRGADPSVVFPFAYFLSNPPASVSFKNPDPDLYIHVLCVSYLNSNKRVEWLIRYLLSANNPKLRVTILGSGPLLNTLTRLARPLHHQVAFLPPTSHDEIYNLMSQADLLVLPSRYDGWGGVVSEALLSGLPVVCSDGCGSSVLLEEHEFGFIFKTTSFSSFSKTMDSAIEYSASSDRLSAADISRVSSACSDDSGAIYLIQILEYLDTPKPTPPWLGSFPGEGGD